MSLSMGYFLRYIVTLYLPSDEICKQLNTRNLSHVKTTQNPYANCKEVKLFEN